ncbi:hypothetical protein IW148_000351 [Coemansia sp. RSA 1199]|nr:hypothetical protein IW148_000351 [Coemansia sp. RSA 1199]
MLARSHKTKDRDGAIDPRAIDLLEAMAMDPAAEHMYRVGHIQQRRRRAVQYIPARMPNQRPSAENKAGIEHSALHEPLHFDAQTPSTAQFESANLAHSLPSAGDIIPRTVPLVNLNKFDVSDAHESADNSDEEVYLRRVSVLYHELWSGDWIDHHMPSAGSADSQYGLDTEGELEVTAHENSQMDDAGTIDCESELEVTAHENSRTDDTGAMDCASDAVLELEPLERAAEAATMQAKITTATKPNTMPGTIALADNGRPDTNDSDKGNRRFPVLHNSWGSLADAYADSSPAVPAPRDRAMPGFSPSDLADALVGTVRRLEDDHTLLQHKRWSVVKELAVTEAHYLRDLLVLRAVFYEPLAEPASSAVLRADDAKTIFGNLNQVIDCARSLVEYLTVAAVYEANRCYALDDEESGDGSCADTSRPNTTQTPPAERVAEMDHGNDVQPRRRCGSRPASQPEAVHFAKCSNLALRNSAWADISIAQAFLLTSQRMERVYAQYCQGFEAASRRIIELKRTAAAASAATAVCATAPTTPMAAHQPMPSGSPFTDHLRGWRQQPAGYSSPAHSSIAGYGGSFGDAASEDLQADNNNPETAYAVAVQQLINEQALLLAGKTTSWDLPSLLIKPVQRILKYPLLIRSLLGLTPTHTLDHNRLEKAAQSVERIAETINAVNSTNGLRISTATTPSLTASSYDSQGRITRELRRVLRRKHGNPNHVRTKSHTESFVKDKLRMSVKLKHRMREPHDRSWPTAASTPTPSSGAEALIKQHETRISELVRALRRWENDLGSMLSQQRALAARWQDLYADIDSSLGPAANIEMFTPSLLSSARQSGEGFVSEGASGRGSNDLSRCFQQQWQLVPDLSLPVPGQIEHARKSKAPCRGANAIEGPGKVPWEALRRERAAQYRAALDSIYASVFPNVVCSPLQTTIYPVLHSLMQIYSDGPRYILSEIARAPGIAAQTATSIAEPDGDRLARLQRTLADDLPKLFEHERTVVQLVLEQVARIQHRFYAQVVEHLSGAATVKPCSAEQATADDSGDSTDDEPAAVRANAGRPYTSGRVLYRTKNAAQNPNRASVPSSSKLIKATFDRRLAERALPSPRTALPSASECTTQIRSGLWLLAQEAQRHGPAQSVVKQRHRRSTIEHGDGSDTVSNNSTSFDEYSSVSVFELASGAENESPVAVGSRSAWSIPVQNSSGDTDVYSDAVEQRSVSSRHMRKKSSGFIERIANFKPGKMIRGHPGSALAPNRAIDGSSMDNIKSRPQLGLGIGITDKELPPIPQTDGVCSSPQSALRAKSDADLRSAAAEWSEDMIRFEPLPTVDPIRFSKGFIDATFQLLDSQNQSTRESPAQELVDTGCKSDSDE